MTSRKVHSTTPSTTTKQIASESHAIELHSSDLLLLKQCQARRIQFQSNERGRNNIALNTLAYFVTGAGVNKQEAKLSSCEKKVWKIFRPDLWIWKIGENCRKTWGSYFTL